MRIDDIIIENQNLEEGPVWDKTRQVGATIGKGIGGVGQAVGAVAGVPAGIAGAIGKGYRRSRDTIAGGPDENPQQGSAQAPQQGQSQSAGGSFAQGLQGGSSGGAGGGVAGKLRQQAKQLMSMADELEKSGDSGGAQKAEPQRQQSAPPTQGQSAPQAQQSTQEPPQASSAQAQPTAQPTAQAEPNTTQRQQSAPQAKNPALAAPAQQQAPADNVSTPSSTGGQTNTTPTGRIHKANPNNPNFKQAGSQPVQDVTPKMIGGPKQSTNVVPFKRKAAEGVEYYSRFLKGMI
jgi:hypothetical protein